MTSSSNPRIKPEATPPPNHQCHRNAEQQAIIVIPFHLFPKTLKLSRTPRPSVLSTLENMSFQFSFSSSAAVVTTANVNGRETTKGVAYRREAYSNEHGTGVRTIKQRLGQDPVVKTRMYDRDGRPLLIEDNAGNGGTGRSRSTQRRWEIDDSRRIVDVTDEENVEERNQRRG